MRVNLGSGHGYMQGWVNVDGNPDVNPDVCMDSFDFVREHGHEVTELYMGHFLEHLLPASATALLAMIADKLPAGAEVSAVVPDMRAVFAAYDRGELTNEFLNERFIYSYEQPSHHVWCYDIGSLAPRVRGRGLRRRRGDRPSHLGSRVLEGRARVALAVRLAGDGAGSRHRAQAPDAAA